MSGYMIAFSYVILGTATSWFLPDLALYFLQRKGINIYPHKRKWLIICLTALSLSLSFTLFSTWYDLLLSLCFWYLLVILSLTDIWSFLLLDRCTYGGILLLLLLRLLHPEPIISYVVASLVIGLLVALLSWSTNGIGMGDAKLLALSALVLGGMKIWIALWLASVFGLLYALFDAWKNGNWQSRKKFPFGPSIAIGSYVTWLWGDQIIGWLV